jgi:hypothetical protein
MGGFIMYTWKINKVSADGELITHAHYEVTANDGEYLAKVAGNHWFSDKILKKPFNQVTETDIAGWIEQETTINNENLIKLDLQKQLEAQKQDSSVALPWLPKTFKLTI